MNWLELGVSWTAWFRVWVLFKGALRLNWACISWQIQTWIVWETFCVFECEFCLHVTVMWIPAGFVSYLRLLFGYETAVWANGYGLDSVCNSDCIHFEYGASDRPSLNTCRSSIWSFKQAKWTTLAKALKSVFENSLYKVFRVILICCSRC